LFVRNDLNFLRIAPRGIRPNGGEDEFDPVCGECETGPGPET